MSRHRLTSIVVLVGANGVAAVGSSGSAVLATLVLSLTDRGVMVLVMTVIGVVLLVGRLGCGTALRSQLPQAETVTRRQELLAAYTWFSVVAALVTGAAAALAVRASAQLFGAAMADSRLLVAVALTGSATMLLDQLTDLRFADGKFRQGAAWNMAATGAGFAGMAAGAVVSAQIWLLLLLQASALTVVAALQWALVRRQGLVRFHRPRRADVRGLVRLGVPALGFLLGASFLQRTDRYLLGLMVGPGAVGIYSLAATLSGVLGLLPTAVGQLSQRDAATRRGSAWPARTICYTLLAVVVAGTVVAAGAWLLVVPVFGPEFGPARALVIPLLVAELCLAPFGIASRALLGAGGTRQAAWVGLYAAVGSVTCYSVMISRWGMPGAAAASVLLYATTSMVALVVLRTTVYRAARTAQAVPTDAPVLAGESR